MARSKKSDFGESVLPQAAQLPWTSGLLKKSQILEKTHLAQAAKLPRTSGFFQKVALLEKFCPRQRSCPGQVVSSETKIISEEVLPQAAKLPRTSATGRTGGRTDRQTGGRVDRQGDGRTGGRAEGMQHCSQTAMVQGP